MKLILPFKFTPQTVPCLAAACAIIGASHSAFAQDPAPLYEWNFSSGDGTNTGTGSGGTLTANVGGSSTTGSFTGAGITGLGDNSAHRLGKLRALRCVLCLAIVVFISTWWLYTPQIVWLQVFASGSIAFTGAGFWLLMGSIGADVMDYDELECGRRREGGFSACGSWINKVGMAGGAGVSFFILEWIGFDSNVAIQSPHTIFMIRLLLIAIPIVGLGLSVLALMRFPLTQEKMTEIRNHLEARRGKV